MRSRAAKKPAAADEEDAKSRKIRFSRGKRRHRSQSTSPSGSDSPPRKRSKKDTTKIGDRKGKRSKGSSASRRRHRHRHRSLSASPSSGSSSVSRGRSRHVSSASERSVSQPPRSRFIDTRKSKGRCRDREKDRRKTRKRRSRSYSSSPSDGSGSSGSRSRSSKGKGKKQSSGGTMDDAHASTDKIAQDYGNCRAYQTEKNSAEDVDKDVEAIAFAKGMIGVDDYERNVGMGKTKSSPSEDSDEAVKISPSKDANESVEILHSGSGSLEAEEDLELILRQKALENFRKFRGAAAMASKADISGSGKEVLTDSPQNTVTKIAESRSAATPFQRQGSRADANRSTSYTTSPGSRNGGSVMQRLGNTPGSSASVKQRLGSSAVLSAVPRVRSVVSLPVREGFDGSSSTMSPTACENPVPVESSSEIKHLSTEVNKFEGTNGDGRKTSEAPGPESSVLSTEEGRNQTETEDKDGSQFEKRTFSRMHDGETVQVSYKVYIPTKSPRLAKKLQR